MNIDYMVVLPVTQINNTRTISVISSHHHQRAHENYLYFYCFALAYALSFLYRWCISYACTMYIDCISKLQIPMDFSITETTFSTGSQAAPLIVGFCNVWLTVVKAENRDIIGPATWQTWTESQNDGLSFAVAQKPSLALGLSFHLFTCWVSLIVLSPQ